MTTDDTHDAEDRAETTGQGYPEEQPAGAGIDAREHPENDIAEQADDEPATSSDRDGDPAQATGNPRAAGGAEDR